MKDIRKRFNNVDEIGFYANDNQLNVLFFCDAKNGDFYIDGTHLKFIKETKGYIGQAALVHRAKERVFSAAKWDGSYILVSNLSNSLRNHIEVFLSDGSLCELHAYDAIPSIVFRILLDSCAGVGIPIDVLCISEEYIRPMLRKIWYSNKEDASKL